MEFRRVLFRSKPPPCGGFFVPGPRSPGKRSAPGTCGPREKRCVCKLVGAGANALGGKCPPASACGRRLLLDFAPKDIRTHVQSCTAAHKRKTGCPAFPACLRSDAIGSASGRERVCRDV